MSSGFESRRMGSKKPATELVTGFSDSVVPPAGCPRAAGAARFRCVAPLLACCAGKRLRVSSAPHPVGFESRRWRRKKPVTTRVTGFAFQMVPPAGFEPAISTLKGWRPWPLDDGDSGKEYSRLFCRRVYRWQTGKPPQRCLSPLWWLGEEFHGGVVGGVFVGVVEGLERQQGCGLRIAAALESVGNEPVGELGVLGQCWSV